MGSPDKLTTWCILFMLIRPSTSGPKGGDPECEGATSTPFYRPVAGDLCKFVECNEQGNSGKIGATKKDCPAGTMLPSDYIGGTAPPCTDVSNPQACSASILPEGTTDGPTVAATSGPKGGDPECEGATSTPFYRPVAGDLCKFVECNEQGNSGKIGATKKDCAAGTMLPSDYIGGTAPPCTDVSNPQACSASILPEGTTDGPTVSATSVVHTGMNVFASGTHADITKLLDGQHDTCINVTFGDMIYDRIVITSFTEDATFTAETNVNLTHTNMICEQNSKAGTSQTKVVMEYTFPDEGEGYWSLRKKSDRCNPFCSYQQVCDLDASLSSPANCVFKCTCPADTLCTGLGVVIGQESFDGLGFEICEIKVF